MWMTKWDITSKVDGGNTFSKVDMISVTSTFSISIVVGLITFAQIFLKNQFRLIIDFLTSSYINVQRQRGSACCINIC